MERLLHLTIYIHTKGFSIITDSMVIGFSDARSPFQPDNLKIIA